MARVGVISDTHGYLDPRVLALFDGVDGILHAGDVGDPAVLVQLAEIAPLTAVAGNLDAELDVDLPNESAGELGPICFVMGHKRKRLMKRLTAGKIECPGGRLPDLVVFGHEHIASASWVEGALFLNPGSASAPYEEDDTPTVAIVETGPVGLSVTFVPLERRA
jgi:putative phosphoesterase